MSKSDAKAATQFIRAYMNSPDDADIEIGAGRREPGAPREILINVVGVVAITANLKAAKTLLALLEDVANEYGKWKEGRQFDNLILGLREVMGRYENRPHRVP